MNINKNFNDVTIFNNKKILLIGPVTNNINKLNIDAYDYILIFGFYTSHLKQLIEYKKKFNFSICRVLGGYGKEWQEKYVLPYDNYINYYFLAEIHTVNEYIKENIISKTKLFSMNNNYKSFGWITEGKYPTGLPKLLLFFHVNNIKFKELFISGFTFFLDSKTNLSYDDTYWINIVTLNYKSYQDKNINDLDNVSKLFIEMYEEIQNGTACIKEQQTKYFDKLWEDKTGNGAHCYKLDYNFFLKYLSMYGSFVKLDKKLKKIVKKYNKLFDV